MTIPAHDVHLLTHTARMLIVLDRDPGHGRAPEYRRQLKVYAGRWAELAPDEQTAVIEAAGEIHDMTADTITAAVAALEG